MNKALLKKEAAAATKVRPEITIAKDALKLSIFFPERAAASSFNRTFNFPFLIRKKGERKKENPFVKQDVITAFSGREEE